MLQLLLILDLLLLFGPHGALLLAELYVLVVELVQHLDSELGPELSEKVAGQQHLRVRNRLILLAKTGYVQ